ncbi:peptidylprolyl isomerase [Pasteurellaceae bacterium RH1A]|nr:peptidylprolyl isomerase [Pasteurellaceae bacterium RH1A]
MKFTSAKSFFVAFIALFSASQIVAAAERVVAIVDDYMIMESQAKRFKGKGVSDQQAIDKAIDDYLVQRAIQQSGVKVNYAQVDQIIENIAIQNGITYGQLLDALDYQGITLQAYRRQIANQLMMQQVQQQAIGQSIQVSAEDVQAKAMQMIEQAKAKGNLKAVSGTEHRVSHILIKTNPILNDAQAKAKLNEIVADIKSGKTTFEAAAQANSLDYLSGADGGDLGWNFLDAYDPAFAKVARASKKEVISAPFKSQFGWHVLKVTDTRTGDRTEDAYRQKAYEQIVNSQAAEASKDWVKALRKVAHIEYIK